jgi:hypothetical protein
MFIPDCELAPWKFYRYKDVMTFEEFISKCLDKEKRRVANNEIFIPQFNVGDLVKVDQNFFIYKGQLRDPILVVGSGSFIAHYEFYNLEEQKTFYFSDGTTQFLTLVSAPNV